ncbi:hypothetical protein D9611_008935 [Ephemerocybe angulata]|uniref:NACHT domain-containing protein n=1 Tax=Ephemerocybe angulata TaxID=980116 RepID=A0A8H5FCF8_9AGAR|nr:hypothetical protein D9611_008935 [Tulosesus angulatus]
MDPAAAKICLQRNQLGTSFFQGAHNFTIDNQYNIGEQTIHNVKPASLGLLDILDPIPDASYTRNRKVSPPDSSCLPGTRQEVIEKVTSWAESSVLRNNPHVMWLYGYVGCGKSAIAQEVAQRWACKKRLAASFFFFRGSGDRGRTARFAATLASQISGVIPSTSRFIEASVKTHTGLLSPNTSTTAQLQRLVYDPIKAVKWDLMGANALRGAYLIVIDGLDECDDHDEISSIMDQMLKFFRENPRVPLRILITSRVQEHIRTRLNPTQVHLFNLIDHTSLDDISAAFRATFTLAAKYSRVIQAYGEWPSEADLRKLAEHAGCSFIFMSAIAKFILDPSDHDGLTPMDRLPLAINDLNPGLDGLYNHTLAQAEHLSHFSDIIWTIALTKRPLSIDELAALLDIRTFEVIEVLVKLHSILQVPGDDNTPVTLCHSSLHDFLTTESRSGRFHASQEYNKHVAYQCMRLLGTDGGSNSPITCQSLVTGCGFGWGQHDHHRSWKSVKVYALQNWNIHWQAFVKFADPQDCLQHHTSSLITHLRQTHSPYCELVLAAYILMDPELLKDADVIVNSEFIIASDYVRVRPGTVRDALMELLQEKVPPTYTKVILQALDIRRSTSPSPDCEELRAIWEAMTPPLPALAQYYSDLVEIVAEKTFFYRKEIKSSRKESVRFTCSTRSRRSLLLFAWCLMSWPQLLGGAAQHQPKVSYSLPKEVRPYHTNGDFLLPSFVRCLCKKESTRLREKFVLSVRLAIQLVGRPPVRLFAPNLP